MEQKALLAQVLEGPSDLGPRRLEQPKCLLEPFDVREVSVSFSPCRPPQGVLPIDVVSSIGRFCSKISGGI